MNFFRRRTCRTDPEHGNHKFEARFSEIRNDISFHQTELFSMGRFPSIPVDKLRSLLYTKVFVRDICVHCGMVVEQLDSLYAVVDPNESKER